MSTKKTFTSATVAYPDGMRGDDMFNTQKQPAKHDASDASVAKAHETRVASYGKDGIAGPNF